MRLLFICRLACDADHSTQSLVGRRGGCKTIARLPRRLAVSVHAARTGRELRVPSHNDQVAADMFRAATRVDPSVCDGWLGRILAGEDSLEVLAGAWAASETFGWEIRRLRVLGADFRPVVFDGLFLQLPICSVDALRCAYATALIGEQRYSQADELLTAAGVPADPFDADMHSYVNGLLHFRTQRWTDVLRLFRPTSIGTGQNTSARPRRWPPLRWLAGGVRGCVPPWREGRHR
jgi:hypothetical protein